MHLIPGATRPRLPGAAVVLPVALCLTLAAVLSGCGADASRTTAASDTVPPYYAETIAILPPAYDNPLNLSIRNTATGLESAALRVSSPYQSIGFVAGTGKPNWWIVGAQPWHPANYDNSAQPVKLYLATMEPVVEDGNPMSEDMLTPLPVAPVQASQLINRTAASSSVRQLAAATVSPDGRRLALVFTQDDTYEVSVYPVTGHAAARTWSDRVEPTSRSFEWGFSLTWLSDDKTLAVGVATGNAMTDTTAAVRYLNTASPGSSLAQASRTVTLSFPAKKAKTGTPDGCYGVPVATSDGRRVFCSGTATYPVNAAGATEVGIWVFSALDRDSDRSLERAHDLLRAVWHRLPPHPVGQPARHAPHRERDEHAEPGGAAVPAQRRRHAAAASLEGPDPPPGPGQHHRAVHRLVTVRSRREGHPSVR